MEETIQELIETNSNHIEFLNKDFSNLKEDLRYDNNLLKNEIKELKEEIKEIQDKFILLKNINPYLNDKEKYIFNQLKIGVLKKDIATALKVDNATITYYHKKLKSKGLIN